MVGKLTGSGSTVTTGAGGGGAFPVPLNITICGVPGALSMMESVACCDPVDVGANVMFIEQNLAGASAEGAWQVSDSWYWLGSAPASEMELTLRASLPLLVRVIICGVLVVPV